MTSTSNRATNGRESTPDLTRARRVSRTACGVYRFRVSAVAVLIAAALSACACTSIQWLDATGHPRSIGLANVTSSPADENVTRIVAPGLALRLIPGLTGYSIGWRETVLFQRSDGPQRREIVAYADRIYGVGLDPTQLVIGAEHRFAVFEPPDTSDVVQYIFYSEPDPTASRMYHEEVR
jgi:hypothetical protein